MRRTFRVSIPHIAAVMAALVFIVGCNGNKTSPEKGENNIVYDFSTDLAYNQGLPANRTFFNVTSDESWTITVTDSETGLPTDWVRADPDRGTGNKVVWLSGESPNYGFPRSAVIDIEFETSSDRITIRQDGYNQPLQSVPGWKELPAVSTDGNTFFLRHFCTIAGERVRNYSMLYDRTTYTAYWVAYPLHSAYLSTVTRSNDWKYDPAILSALQLNYSSAGFGNNTWDRGHQIASADRNATDEMNEQTFHYTNITPQRWQLNQVKWANLETFLRDKVKDNLDSMWVVTGAVFHDRTGPGNENILTLTNAKNPGIEIPVPNYYYKVALWHKTPQGGGAGKYTAVGFWMENVDATGSITSADAYTVREIERKTGFDFFANFPAAEQAQFEGGVVSADWF